MASHAVERVGTAPHAGVTTSTSGSLVSPAAAKGLFVITGLDVGGAETMLLRLLSRIDRRKFTPAVVSLRSGGPLKSKLQELEVPVYELDWRLGLPRPHSLANLVRTIRDLHPDFIQGWMVHANLAVHLLRLASRRKIPLIWNVRHSLHGFGVFGDFQPARRSTAVLIRLLRRMSSWPDRIVYVSHTSALQHERLGYDARRTTVFPNGFDCDLFRPRAECRKTVRAALGLAADTPLVGLIARVHPVKDHRNFLQSAAMLNASGSPAHFLLVGKGTNGEEVANLIEALGLRGRVHALGERTDVPELTAALDVATSSSRSEAFSNTIGEAMACGVPCVATDVGDSARLVGETGRVVPSGDAAAFSGALRELLELDSDRRRELGEAARKRILREFSLDHVVSCYENLYAELVHGK